MSCQRCRVCQCTDDDACLFDVDDGAGGSYVEACRWVEPDLCSACVEQPGKLDATERHDAAARETSGPDGFVLQGGLWLR